MKILSPYLTFNGNCKEAMSFYHACLGGELTLQTVGESPMSGSLPEKMRDCILHGALNCRNATILGSDMVHESGLIRGNSMSLMVDCENSGELERLANCLSEGGKMLHPIETTHWGALLCTVTDPYGNFWILHLTK